jgi:hypothetical protein
MKHIIKQILGIDSLESSLSAAIDTANTLRAQIDELSQHAPATPPTPVTPKEHATLNGEPWVDAVKLHVNKSNVRHGFFELDWNSYFILELKRNGYGCDGDPEEEIVDRWFRTLARDICDAEGISTTERSAGIVDFRGIRTQE